MKNLEEAHIPSWLKIKLSRLRGGDRHEESSYVWVGYHLGRYHVDDFCEDRHLISDANEHEVLTSPTRVLRRIFASDDHPKGDLADYIPKNRRREFLIGILAGVCEDEPTEGWLALVA